MVSKVEHPSVAERRAQGKEARERTPPSSHTGWAPVTDRPDPVALLEEQNLTREPDLVPVRHGRMMTSPFTFYRGAAKIMAADLKDTPTAGLSVQLCGDAHLSNFGVFASPERALLFDLNDFDETLPGPFEYDVKRMAASFTIAARNNGFAKADARAATLASVRAYREAMAEFAEMGTMEIWYAHLSEQDLMDSIRAATTEWQGEGAEEGSEAAPEDGREGRPEGAHPRQPAGAVQARRVGRRPVPDRQPTTIVVPARDLEAARGFSTDQMQDMIHDQFRAYRDTLQDDRRQLLERFEVIDMARKVVGVGSVGTRAFIVLLQGRDRAGSAVPPGQRGDDFGARGPPPEEPVQAARRAGGPGAADDAGGERHLPGLDEGGGSQTLPVLASVARHEGLGRRRVNGPGRARVLRRRVRLDVARAHARSGDPVALAAYLGKSDSFDQSITDFSERYADQNDRDYRAFAEAIRSGRLEAIEGL